MTISGYDYVNEVNVNLICCICQLPFYEPVTITSCGHTFCRQCITASLNLSGSRCPIDRRAISSLNDIEPANYLVKNMVDELTVRCPNDGCEEIMQRQNLSDHLGQCEYFKGDISRGTQTDDKIEDEVLKLKDEIHELKAKNEILEMKCENLNERLVKLENNTANPAMLESISGDIEHFILNEIEPMKNDLSLLFSLVTSLQSNECIDQAVKEILQLKIDFRSLKSLLLSHVAVKRETSLNAGNSNGSGPSNKL